MDLNGKNILLASLLGASVVESVPRFSLVENELQKRVLPPIPFLPFKNQSNVDAPNTENWTLAQKLNKPNISAQFVPLSMRRAGTDDPFYTLPYEPLITINGKNNVVKRNIAKAPNFVGTIKEYWSQDDYSITITGVLMGENEHGNFDETFPESDFEELRKYCLSPTGLEVHCDMLQILGINNIVVEDFTFPFSKGENVQAYDIKAVSDFSGEFLLEIKE